MSKNSSPTLAGKTTSALQSMSLQTRLLLTSILLVLIPALITTTISTYISSQGLTNAAFDQLESVATLKENQIRIWLDTLQTSLELVFADQQSIRLVTAVINQEEEENNDAFLDKSKLRFDLERYTGLSGYFTEIFIMNTNGVVLLSTIENQENKIFSNQNFFTEGIKGSFINPPTYEPAFSNYSIIISQPLVGQNGKIIGVLAGRVNLSTLNSIMSERAGLGETGETYLVNANFAALTNLRFQEIILGKTYIQTDGAAQAIETQSNGRATYNDYRNTSVLGVYHWIPELKATVLAEQDETEALESSNALFRANLIFTFLTIIVASGIAFIITRQISTPITELAKAADNISHGSLDVEVKVNRGDEIGVLATSFNLMTTRLRDMVLTLEQRVTDRTKALATATEVSRRLSNILDERQLVTEVVEQVQKAYDYYHGQIYLLDASGQTLVLAGATGTGGKALLDKKHSLSLEKGLVGRVARTKAAVFVSDTSQDPEWLPNPLLPDTKAEIAIPILLGEKLLGVLDMQDDVVGDIHPEDVEYLTAIANQTAIALQNARSLAQAQKRAEREELITSISQKIQQETTMENAMKVAVREVGRALGTSAVVKLKPGNGKQQGERDV
ncbi:MAG: GAF domain-containing protein [Anaerolineae bacterium]|nr:GAF domain-containing protein [Anaerolineae bacterium]